MKFEIEKKSKNSRARLGLLKTPHGVVETPCLVPVATQAVVKTLNSNEAELAKSQILICNTFHLHLKPGEKIAANLHKFMNWRKPLMTDSGGFQVFSLGFGRDSGVGKIFTGNLQDSIKKKQQPKQIKITKDGVYFKSPLDGSRLFLGPKESIRIQEELGADIIFAFDECTSPLASKEYVKESLERTHKWAETCIASRKTKQALFGIVQGGRFKDLRVESSNFISSLPFDGFGIGGEFGNGKKEMVKMIGWVLNELPEEKPRHLLGIGHLEDIIPIIRSGVDTFDCVVPTRLARHNTAFTKKGRINLSQAKFLKDKKPLDPACPCFVCQKYKRNYISHLIRAKEMTGIKLLTFHNLYFFNYFVENVRNDIKSGKI